MPPRQHFYMPELDVLRFLAFLMVDLHHALPRHAGAYEVTHGEALSRVLAAFANMLGGGLCLFFFLSAYLIGRLLQAEAVCGGVRLGAFYLRRVLRIWPLYFVALMLAVLWGLAEQGRVHWPWLLSYASFTGNWYFLQHQWTPNPFTPLWSISVEEQFYLLFPLVLLWAGPRRMREIGAATVGLSAAALYWQGSRGVMIDTSLWVHSLSQAMFFGAGILMASLPHEQLPTLRLRERVAVFAFALLIMFGACYFADVKRLAVTISGPAVVLGYALMAMGCALVFLAVQGLDVRRLGALVYLGKISFGLYVFHLAAVMLGEQVARACWGQDQPLAAAVLAAVLVVVLAHLSYRYVESPFLRLKQRWSVVQGRPA